MTYIVIRRPYGHLEDEVRRVFGGREDVKVVVDRRSAERRATQQPVSVERRRFGDFPRFDLGLHLIVRAGRRS